MLSPHPVCGSPPPASGKTAVQARPIPHTLRLTCGSLCWEGEGQTSPSGMLLAWPHDCLSLTNYLQSKGPWQPLVIFHLSIDIMCLILIISIQAGNIGNLSVIKGVMAGRLDFLYLKEKITFYLCAHRCPERPEGGVGFSAAGVRGSCELPDMVAGN